MNINSWLQVLQLARTQLKNRVAARGPERVYYMIFILEYLNILIWIVRRSVKTKSGRIKEPPKRGTKFGEKYK